MTPINNQGYPLIKCANCWASNFVKGGYNGGGNCPACGVKLLSDKDLMAKYTNKNESK